MNVGSVLSRNAVIFKNKPAIWFYNQSVTWDDLNRKSNQAAHAFKERGIKKGDVVALVTENCVEMVEIIFGLAKLGAISYPVNTRLSVETIQQLVDLSQAKLLVVQQSLLPLVPEFSQPNSSQCMVIGVSKTLANYDDAIEGRSTEDPEGIVNSEDIFILFGTGGTTGLPKLVALSHQASMVNAMNMICDYGFTCSDVGLQVLPLYHVVFNTLFLPYVFVGASVVMLDVFNPEAILQNVAERGVTIFSIVPPVLINRFESAATHYDLSSVRYFLTAAASFSPELKRKTQALFSNTRLGYSYGLSEMGGGNVTILDPNHQFTKDGSIGVVTKTLNWRVVQDNGDDVPKGTIGELVLNGPTMMTGYYRNETATKDTVRDGWCYTGDLVREDSDGYLYLVDRRKNMIKTGGENVYAKIVEDYLTNHPQVVEAAVLGLPDPQWGERVVAVVVARDGVQLNESEVVEFCKAGLARYEVPKRVVFVSELPRNSSGKVVKSMLRSIVMGET
jgi:acyl-CoA synthetase (AMP-forming)/AMP-acid ligase II